MTRQYVLAVAGTGATILDTRKTTPGLRSLEKYAVRLGGGSNHRFGLFDMVLIKDNHLHLVGDVKKAIALGRKGGEKVEVEVRTMEGVREAVEAGADRIMLDNMSLDSMRQAVSYIKRRAGGKGRIEVEASGGIGLATVRQVAATGVDSISVGALTHSCRALDIAFYLR
jgi:nicotinate-nucleotide pyrophosphorylase (carboxylating)